MKQIFAYLQKYWKAHYHLGFYLTTAIFLAVSIYFNYKYNFENGYIDSFYRQWTKLPLMSITTMLPFLVICGFMYVFNINRTWVKSKEFWILFLLAFVLIGFQRSFFLHYYLIDDLPHADRLYGRKILWYLRPYLTTLIPILIFYNMYEKKRDEDNAWYGLKVKDTDFTPYFILVGVVFIGVGLGSFIGDLTSYYPRFNKSGAIGFANAHNLPKWMTIAFYELLYGANFLNVEFFFRGFLVIGFMRVLGGHAVMAMVGSYVFLHFGKPMTECISSAFGGYIIGVFAYYSKRIWGGVVLHIALAWSMELFAWLQKIFGS
ncbi:CPBP family intramembrane metalloprotease [Reichenbachiella versicolor]|uniref:CPBP family intramembrane metalloprotease n=1 Tax=Reichenbachiella versicolor TaxID=1821036 RepID=UPI000D6DD868|nr:CPBP family intramembrane metalloprotease [Reichenbachiella versicolor]